MDSYGQKMRSPPEDTWHMVYAIFFLQGVGQLLPWNVFINAEDYFRRRFCGSSVESSFEDFFAVGYNFACISGLVLALRYQNRFSVRGRVLGSLAISVLTFLVCSIFVLLEGASAGFLFAATMTCILASGLSIAVLQGGLFAMASALPPKFTQAMMAGQGLAGLGVALAGIFTTLAGRDDISCEFPSVMDDTGQDGLAVDNRYFPHLNVVSQQQEHLGEVDGDMGSLVKALTSTTLTECTSYSSDVSTLVYFAIAVAVSMACMVSFPVLERLPLTIFYMQPAVSGVGQSSSHFTKLGDSEGQDGDGCGSGGEAIDTSSAWRVRGSSSDATVIDASPESTIHQRLVEAPQPSMPFSFKPLSDRDTVVLEEDEQRGDNRERAIAITDDSALSDLRAKLAPIARYAFAVFFTFMVTLSVFPGITSQIVSSRQCLRGRARFFATDVFVLFSFVSFNVFDFLGRVATGARVVIPVDWLPAASIMRLIFVPLFLACRLPSSRLPQWLSADPYPLILMPLFAFTNGYVGSLGVMTGSQNGPWAGTAMVLSLNTGLLAGSSLSFLILFISTGQFH